MRVGKALAMGFIAVSVVGLVGCGGGGADAKITQDSVDKLGKNVAKALPGCEYNSNNVLSARMDDDLAGAYLLLRDEVNLRKEQSPTTKLGAAVNKTENGSCGGTSSQVGTEENGAANVTYTFANYCTGDANKKTVVDGTITVNSVSNGSDLESVEISTGAGGVVTVATAGGSTTRQSIELSNFKYVVGKSGQPSRITADKLRVDSGGSIYEITGQEAEISGDVNGGTLTIKHATYRDPEVGAVTVKTTPLNFGSGASGAGVITLTGSDGSVEFKTNDMSTMKFTAYLDNKPSGCIDCSKANGN